MWRNLQVYPQGKMSQCMERLSIGDTLRFKGPRGKFRYQPNMKRAIGEPSKGISPTEYCCCVNAAVPLM